VDSVLKLDSGITREADVSGAAVSGEESVANGKASASVGAAVAVTSVVS